MQMDERILAEGCREGDGAARRELYDRFAGRLMAVCMRYAGDRATAEDLLHDAFLKIYGAFGKFSYRGPRSLRAWMLGINEKSSSSQLFRARALLARKIRAYLESH